MSSLVVRPSTIATLPLKPVMTSTHNPLKADSKLIGWGQWIINKIGTLWKAFIAFLTCGHYGKKDIKTVAIPAETAAKGIKPAESILNKSAILPFHKPSNVIPAPLPAIKALKPVQQNNLKLKDPKKEKIELSLQPPFFTGSSKVETANSLQIKQKAAKEDTKEEVLPNNSKPNLTTIAQPLIEKIVECLPEHDAHALALTCKKFSDKNLKLILKSKVSYLSWLMAFNAERARENFAILNQLESNDLKAKQIRHISFTSYFKAKEEVCARTYFTKIANLLTRGFFPNVVSITLGESVSIEDTVAVLEKQGPVLTSLSLNILKQCLSKEVCQAIVDNCEELRKLSLDMRTTSIDQLLKIGEKNKKITLLHLENPLLTVESVRELAARFPHVTHLQLEGPSPLSDVIIEAFAQNFLKVEKLSLSHFPGITLKSIEALAKFPNLKYVIISECNNVWVHTQNDPTQTQNILNILKNNSRLVLSNNTLDNENYPLEIQFDQFHFDMRQDSVLDVEGALAGKNNIDALYITLNPALPQQTLYSRIEFLAKKVPHLKDLRLQCSPNLSDADLKAIVGYFPSLEKLSLYETSSITPEGLSALALSKTLKQVQVFQSNLESNLHNDSYGKKVVALCPSVKVHTVPKNYFPDSEFPYLPSFSFGSVLIINFPPR